VIDQVSVRNHGKCFTLTKVSKANGARKKHCEGPDPVFKSKNLRWG
jgi:hypothetical protein